MSCNNITFLLEEQEQDLEKKQEQETNETFTFFDLEQIDSSLNHAHYNNDDSYCSAVKMVDYNLNYTVKGLLHIGEYYGIAKNLKACKLNKEQIIEAIIMFESIPENYEIVLRRQKMWHFMNELNKDKFMRKFILCWK
jgi:hypothetical protein